MSRELISALYETVWTVDPGNDHLYALVGHLIQMIDAMCGAASIPCRISASEIAGHYPVSGSLRHNVSMATKEVLHNAIKHSGALEIKISFTWAPPLLTICLSDNGRGFEVEIAGEGHGLKNVRERIKVINGELFIKSHSGKGTEVTLKLPIL